MSNNINDPIISVETILNCSAEQAFNYFSQEELLTKWLTKKAVVEMKVGGKYELYWAPEDNDPTNDSTYGCQVLAVDRPHVLSIEWKGNKEQKHFMNTVQPLTNVTIMFFGFGTSATKVILLHTGWRQGAEWNAAKDYFRYAWSTAFSQLKRISS